MPKKTFTDLQIAFALRQAEAGTTIGEICRRSRIARTGEAFGCWKNMPASASKIGGWTTMSAGRIRRSEF